MALIKDIQIRPLLLSDAGNAMRLSVEQNWNQTLNDWELLIGSPQHICLLAELDQKIVGTITAMIYGGQVAWLGMVLVDKDYRGRGISKLLLQHMFTKLRGIQSIKLDATPEGQQVYNKMGFTEEYAIARLTTLSLKKTFFYNDTDLPQQAQVSDLAAIIKLDASVFGANRSGLIEWLVNKYPHKAWVLKRNQFLAGFALGRDGKNYNHIGPVAAASLPDAQLLISTAFTTVESMPVVVDVPCDKEGLIQWLKDAGFEQQRCFVRMYQQDNSFPGNTKSQYVICGPEFG